VTLARSGHIRQPRKAGPVGRSDGAASGRKLVSQRAEQRSAGREKEQPMYTEPYQRQNTPGTVSRSLTQNTSRVVSRALNAYH
jgi:hypothetical protein